MCVAGAILEPRSTPDDEPASASGPQGEPGPRGIGERVTNPIDGRHGERLSLVSKQTSQWARSMTALSTPCVARAIRA